MDDFFEPKRTSLLEYHTCIEDACGQTVSYTPTSVHRAQGALDSLPRLPSSPPSHGSRKSHVWRLMCRPVGSDGGLFPTGLADDYFPISSALSSLGTNTGNQPAENVRTPCNPSCLFCACNTMSAHQESLWKSINSRWEVQKCLLGFGKQEREISLRVG